ncbi:SDR family NAD(P)-dependent oxidoreductase [Nocardia sp. alder85J]|uniref:SDR family NAD(P)-dependent oxidoreductase n=1 Tax=Nocardia sp. alder85J TaxID=2862949 RepID=UPI001CD2ABC1|nr:SDR family NAD(P)-dependent oxidoreductase [Nocardia sp. alder85J]MCX4091346.1 SDR family NAD(P)-dependent oxidoreductase [Nocardia sp. alder85J]
MSRVAVITGGGSGIGAEIAREFGRGGHRVAVLDIDAGSARRVAEEIQAAGGRALAIGVDVTDRPALEEAFAKVRSEFGPVGILVPSAGIVAFEPFTEISADSWNRVVDVNLNGTFHCCQLAIPDMVAAGWGRIVTISSSSAQRGSPRMTHYAAAKGAVIALTKSLAREYATAGITVNNIPPSGIETEMQHQSQQLGDLPSNEVMAAAIPLGYLGTPADIATATAFLASDQARYVTGQVLGVNGGSVL